MFQTIKMPAENDLTFVNCNFRPREDRVHLTISFYLHENLIDFSYAMQKWPQVMLSWRSRAIINTERVQGGHGGPQRATRCRNTHPRAPRRLRVQVRPQLVKIMRRRILGVHAFLQTTKKTTVQLCCLSGQQPTVEEDMTSMSGHYGPG